MLLAILVLRQKNAQIMLDSENNATLVPENALFYFKKTYKLMHHVCLSSTE